MLSIAIVILTASGHFPSIATAAQPAAPKGEVRNVRIEEADGGAVRIRYDLAGDPGTIFVVAVNASLDGGATFDYWPVTLFGDVGPAVTAGTDKAILWRAPRDVEKINFNRLGFRILVEPAAPGAAAARPPSAPPAPASIQPPPAASPSSPPSGSGSRMKMYGLIGGGAAAAVLVAAAGGGDTVTPPPQANRAPVAQCGDIKINDDTDLRSTDVGIAGATTYGFAVNASDPDGGAVTVTINYGDGASGSDRTHVYNNAGTYAPSVTVADASGATATCAFAQREIVVGTIAGAWLGGATTGATSSLFNLSQNGSAVTGTYREDNGLTFQIRSGVVERRGTFASVRLTVARSSVPGDELTVTVEPSTDLRTLTGTFTYLRRSGSVVLRR
jgi:hypothetical protein